MEWRHQERPHVDATCRQCFELIEADGTQWSTWCTNVRKEYDAMHSSAAEISHTPSPEQSQLLQSHRQMIISPERVQAEPPPDENLSLLQIESLCNRSTIPQQLLDRIALKFKLKRWFTCWQWYWFKRLWYNAYNWNLPLQYKRAHDNPLLLATILRETLETEEVPQRAHDDDSFDREQPLQTSTAATESSMTHSR